jgi:hypothetical protein
MGPLRRMQTDGERKVTYEIMKISCQSCASVLVMYTHPPAVNVRKAPTAAIAPGREDDGRRMTR